MGRPLKGFGTAIICVRLTHERRDKVWTHLTLKHLPSRRSIPRHSHYGHNGWDDQVPSPNLLSGLQRRKKGCGSLFSYPISATGS